MRVSPSGNAGVRDRLRRLLRHIAVAPPGRSTRTSQRSGYPVEKEVNRVSFRQRDDGWLGVSVYPPELPGVGHLAGRLELRAVVRARGMAAGAGASAERDGESVRVGLGRFVDGRIQVREEAWHR